MKYINSIVKREPVRDTEAITVQDTDGWYGDAYYPTTSELTEKQKLANILAMLQKHWLMILGITLIGTFAVIVYEAQKPDYYSAEARIQVNNEFNPAAGGNASGSIVLNSGGDPAYFTTQLQVLEGAGLLRRVVKVMDLEHNPTFFRPAKGEEATVWQNVLRMFNLYQPPNGRGSVLPDSTDNKLNLKTDSTADLDSQAEALAPYVSYLKGNLEISPVRDNRTANKETRLIKVEFRHYDPDVAAKVANTIADTYVLQNLEHKVETNASASDFLQKRVAELQSKIREGEERLINYAKNNQIVSLDATQNTVVQRLADLNGKLSQAENDRITAEAAYRAAMQNPMRSATAESNDARTEGLQTQLTALRQQLEQLKVEYTDEWPEVKKVRQQIATIENELQSNQKRSSDTQIATLEQTYRAAASREDELRRNFETQRNLVLEQNEAAINYRIIQQEIDTNKGLLDNLLQKSRETEVILNGTPNNVLVLDRAIAPRSPEGPQRTKNVIIGLIASLFAGVGLALVLSWLDDTVRPTDNTEAQLGAPVIGIIPGNNGIVRRMLPGRRKLLKKPGKQTYDLDYFQKPHVAEAFHQLRTSLLLSTPGGAPRTILVTSGQPSEGKTLTSLNVANSLAQLGGKVLLIDADLRCPRIHAIKNLRNTSGLSNLLTSDEMVQETIRKSIESEVETNLDILPAGPRVPNAANLFSSVEMRNLLSEFSGMYSYIVIDSPPVLFFADSVVLATIVDAVILIARADHSSRDTLMHAKKKMQEVRANLIGVVLNDVPISSYQYYSSSYYNEVEEGIEDTNGYIPLN
jgi:capsular exopolysaccharide synthesis family protein